MSDLTADDGLDARVKDALRGVIDPELGQNVLDLGLIYDLAVEGRGLVQITMTTTTRGCPATSYLQDGVREGVANVPGVESVDVILTYDPPWTPHRMSAEARQRLGISETANW
jgi:metal-sulfur cluster biosynthetic enzyme